MSIPFTCPHCGHETNMMEEHAGRSGSCVACGKQISVPGEIAKRAKRTDNSWLIIALTGLAILFVIFSCCGFDPHMFGKKEAACKIACKNNIRNLVCAVLIYESDYDAFPSAAGPISSNDAEPPDPPLLIVEDWSWRVRILPYLEQQELYEQFRFDEPWDSEHNLKIAEYELSLFQCPSERPGFKEINGHKIPLSSYVMVSGPNTVGSVDGSTVSLQDISEADGASNTLMIVEVHGKNRPAWTEPYGEITLANLACGVNHEAGIMSVGSKHKGMFNVGFCDGSVHSLSDEITGEELVFMGHWNDGKMVDLENY
jgi:prepilin-type processing-associated H-X9-DG protein